MKRFYNNTLIGGACSKALRVVALLCVLLGFSSSAWGDTYYIDASCISGVQQISWLQYQNGGGDIVPQNTNFNGKTAFQFTADAGKTLKLQLKIVSGNTTIYPQLYNINLSGSNNCIELSLDGSTLSYKAKQGSTLKCAGGCTPSATFTSAVLNGDKINLKGTFNSCEESVYYGWQWSNKLNQWNANNVTNENGGYVTSEIKEKVNVEKNYEFTIPASGTTYYFRTYMVVGTEWVFGTDVKSVKVSGSSSGDVVSGDCESIEIWCDKNYECYVFWNGQAIENQWPGKFGTKDNNDNYYKWTITGHDKVNVIFSQLVNQTRSQTGDIENLEKGYRYIFDNPTLNKDYKTRPEGNKISCEQPSTNVLLSREAIVNKSAKTAQLFGYLKSIKAPNCPTSAIADYGFFYCMVNDGDTPCTPTSSSTKIAADPSPALSRGMEFTATVGLIKEPSDALQDGKTYYYRAYAKIDDKYILSGETRSFSTDPCIPQYGGLSDKYVDGTPIVYTINADPAFAANDCKLHFKSLQAAIDHLKETYTKDDDFKYVTKSGDSYNLNQPVEMRVVYYDDTPDDNTSAYAYRGKSIGANEDFVFTGQNRPVNANLIEDINKSGAKVNNTLSIKAGTNKAKPWIHHIVIRNSKNIVLDSLAIFSDPSGIADNALEIDVNTTQWHTLKIATCADANIVIQNSMIGSAGFTGVHVSGYEGITFKNNDFEAIFDGTDGDAVTWGASAKFMASKNIKFIQNNFRGDHACLLWLQESQNFLIMNNVFWNTNKYASKENVSAIKLVAQFGDQHKNRINLENIDIYYNTFYLAEEKQDAKYNFLQLFLAPTDENSAKLDQFVQDGVKFKYNNCYSYDTKTSGIGNYNPGFANFSTQFPNTCPNNFWSEYDQIEYNKLAEDKKASYVSAFAFGCADNKFINVKSQVCSTTASGPASLIVKGKGVDYGVKPDISTTGITLEPNEQYADRYIIGARPTNGEKWTYGAYQSKDNIDTKVIYWVGISSDWDDRNNWEYETEVDGKMVRQRVSCVNNLSEDLKVVVEEIGTVEIADGRKWPQIPASFTENRTNSLYDEHVSAGLGTGKTPTKFASTIELEYGAGIKGVENLREADGTLRYDRAITHFEAERNKWLLVGPVVRPFVSGNSGTTRDVISNDYFKNFEPHIYMHETTIDGDKVSWNKTFGDLNVPILPNTVFAMQASKDYGPYFDNAEDYLKYEGIEVDDKSPTPFIFTGRFAVEEGQHNNNGNYVYSLENGINLLNNVYPCNLNVQELEKLGTVILYDYEKGSFESTTAKNARVLAVVRSQNGFVFTPHNSDLTLELSQDLLTEGSTRTRSGEIVMPSFSLNIDNANTTKPGASNIVISYDEFLGSDESLRNTPKVFTKNTDTPEAYIVNKDAKYSRLVSGKEKVSIPVDIRLLKPMNLTFEKVYNEGYDEVVLVDTKTQKFYNLLKRTYTTDVLSAGDTEGRFYLNLTVSGDDDLDDEGDNPGGDDIVDDDDVTTEVEETIEEADINIYAVDNSIIRVIATGTTLKAIYVNDMAGRTEEFLVDGNFAELQLPVSSGVYTVHVIGDTATKIGKVILK